MDRSIPVESFIGIHSVLAAVRGRLVRQAAGRAALLIGAAAVLGAVLAPLLGAVVAAHRAPTIGGAAMGAAGAAVLAAIIELALSARRWRRERAVAQFVGRQVPPLASDLLSAVELEHAAAGQDPRARCSAELALALAAATEQRLRALDLETVVPRRRLRRPALALAAAAAVAGVAVAAGPHRLARGWTRVTTGGDGDGPLAGARASEVPLVGDVQLTLEYPAYSERPPVTLPASSGDFRALPGTRVTLRTRPLAPAVSAALVFGDTEQEPMELALAAGEITGSFTVTEETEYRFLLRPARGAPLVEGTPHRVELELDEVPVVELYAPADELDVTDQKRIELAYTTEDDYGIAKIELVWLPENGGEPGRRELAPPRPGARSAQGKMMWDLAEVPLPPGARVGYHIAVTDTDTVNGPKEGRSKTFYLRVYSPRERQEELVARQHEMFEHLMRLLGARLTVPVEDLQAHRAIHRDAASLVVELGGVLADARESELTPPDLVKALTEMHGRLEALAAAEGKLVAGTPRAGKLAASDAANVDELERDALQLADWLDRQRLENVLALADEIKAHRERLAELLAEYARTGDPALLDDIEREMRALERKLAEMRRQSQGLSADVMDQFVNTEALRNEAADDCLAEVRALVAAGDGAAAAAKMEECNAMFGEMSDQLEASLEAMRGDRFSEQEAKFDALRGELADLAQDQKEIAAEADEIMERYAERTAELMEEKAAETRSGALDIVDQLEKRLARIPRAGLTPFSADELPVVEQRLRDVRQMLADGDLAEALAMARQAESGLEAIEAELGADLDSGEPWNDRTPDAYNEVAKALPLARQLVELLEKATPDPEEIMSKADKQRMRQLRRRQQAVRERARKLAEKAREQADELPGGAGEQMAEGVEAAMEPMASAEERMKAADPSGSRHEARRAADLLDEASSDATRAARQGQRNTRNASEPVRIPGADEYKAPEEFREEILEAMKKEAPAGFGDQVRRYYEELIK